MLSKIKSIIIQRLSKRFRSSSTTSTTSTTTATTKKGSKRPNTSTKDDKFVVTKINGKDNSNTFIIDDGKRRTRAMTGKDSVLSYQSYMSSHLSSKMSMGSFRDIDLHDDEPFVTGTATQHLDSFDEEQACDVDDVMIHVNPFKFDVGSIKQAASHILAIVSINGRRSDKLNHLSDHLVSVIKQIDVRFAEKKPINHPSIDPSIVDMSVGYFSLLCAIVFLQRLPLGTLTARNLNSYVGVAMALAIKVLFDKHPGNRKFTSIFCLPDVQTFNILEARFCVQVNFDFSLNDKLIHDVRMAVVSKSGF